MSLQKYNQLSDKLIRKSQQNAAKIHGVRGCKIKIRRNRAENRCFFGCVSMCEWQYAYAKYFGFAVSVMFSEKKMLVFFSQVQSFKYGSANLFRSNVLMRKAKADDGFKTVNSCCVCPTV